MPSIEVHDLHVLFPLYHGTARSLKKTVAAATRKKTVAAATLKMTMAAATLKKTVAAASTRLHEDRQHRMVVHALRGLTFSLGAGERLGLVGGNGAGKTTLLRALAGIYEPIAGRVTVKGELHTLLDTGLGMNVDLTGRENIGLRGLYAGMRPKAIRALEDDVQEFADLGGFLDMPVRTYSSGMVVRLGFALATSIRPQVLLMDEWFLAGDTGFMMKARNRLEELVRQAEILVISTHQPDIIAAWCTKVLWLDQGTIRMEGPPDVVLAAYLGHPVEPAAALLLDAS